MENKISAGAVLVDYSISIWSGRRQANDEAEAITTKAKSVKEAASVSKNLMVGTRELSAVQGAAIDVRRFILHYTLPWTDSGVRLLPMPHFNTFAEGLDARIQKFNKAVDALITAYPTIVSAQAFRLGTLFNRGDYPSPESLRKRFKVNVRMFPVPQSGHYLIDAHAEIVEKLQEKAKLDQDASVALMMRDAWQRLYDSLKRLNTLMTPGDNGRVRPIHTSVITGIGEVTSLLTTFNVANDEKLEQARQELEALLAGTPVATMREDENARQALREKTQAILDKFDFGGLLGAETEDS
jgi:hypothetical protein